MRTMELTFRGMFHGMMAALGLGLALKPEGPPWALAVEAALVLVAMTAIWLASEIARPAGTGGGKAPKVMLAAAALSVIAGTTAMQLGYVEAGRAVLLAALAAGLIAGSITIDPHLRAVADTKRSSAAHGKSRTSGSERPAR